MIPLESEGYFHVFNRANGSEKIFLSAENYRFFLERYKIFIAPYVNTLCYCLMTNHFHFLVHVKSQAEIADLLANVSSDRESGKTFPKFRTLEKFSESPEHFISKQFSNFFSSYTQAFNKVNKRKGSLFMKNFKRKPINDELYLKKVVHYIHHNPIDAGICDSPEQWPHSSYNSIISGDENVVDVTGLMNWFGDLDEFKEFHKLNSQLEEADF